ncbi:MAG: Asp-tRNA(Asn)/Glu-tRNA(Gln) amidotransferase subunit GatB [Candidatus Krumholzibacteriota bacterium]|nr:Asp-tRNA(Asn)/Glu-tRNA(Gln) amidotransferase subunit GatB [Candidatus Krumholzibacteriota bacterium]
MSARGANEGAAPRGANGGPAGWEAVIGLEIHAQLRTRSKAFCGCEVRFGGEANTRCCPVCLGLPGALPVLNRRAVELALRVGLALGCRVVERSVMARKNYFYPDLPKGYQITQYEAPLCEGGEVPFLLDGEERRLRLTRIHLEEDAGKSLHAGGETRVDLNRAGVPLIEIVTEPELASPAAAHAFLVALRRLLVWLAVCDGNMEEGSLRCDANVSLRLAGETGLGVKTELKNLNSFRGVEQALAFEIDRQERRLAAGEPVAPETRLWDAARREARPMRGKETVQDYRYFPEPDLPPLAVDAAWREAVRAGLPELPDARRRRLQAEHGLTVDEAELLTADRDLADYYEAAAAGGDGALAAHWVAGEILRLRKETGGFPVPPAVLGGLLARVGEGAVSHTAAKAVLERLAAEGGEPDAWIARLGLARLDDAAVLAGIVDGVLAAHPAELARYRGGRTKLFRFFVGRVMQETGGRADPRLVDRLLRERLDG